MGQRFREAGIELTMFDFRTSPISHFLDLLSLMRRARPDIVQTWMYHADMFGGLAARLTGHRNVIWGIRASELNAGDSRVTVVVRRLCALLSRWAPHTIICVAEAARRVHISVGYDAGRMVVIPNGFDLSRFVVTAGQRAMMRMQCGFGPNDVVVGTLGRFNFDKDQRSFVRAAGWLVPHHERLRFLMVGRELDTGNAKLMSWIAQTGNSDRFVLLGERTDVPICLAAMDVFCLSSRTEAFPNVVAEAMAMELPCVVTDVGDAAMLVADTGVVVPKEDTAALAQGLAQLLAMAPDVRRRLGENARARIRAEFAMERSRERFEAVYKYLTEKGKR
jgi:glycosyltransferase involved in cell wall biosynthesis